MHENDAASKKAHAKINIGLNILGKRADGYHEIETIFQEISLHDELIFQHAEDIILESNDPGCPTDASNLVYRAALLLQKKSRPARGIRIQIQKNIPMRSGLGGGSSDAACTIKTLSERWQIPLSREEEIKTSAEIGSDVPFFIIGGTALGKGRGEILEPVEIISDYWGVLVIPEIKIATAWAFSRLNFNLTKSLKKSNFSAFMQNSADYESWRRVLNNNLEPVVCGTFPQISHWVDQLYKHGAFYAQMSGSGSAVFGLYETKDLAGTPGY